MALHCYRSDHECDANSIHKILWIGEIAIAKIVFIAITNAARKSIETSKNAVLKQ